ncbi:unnamed protein product [Camellia sinensis]
MGVFPNIVVPRNISKPSLVVKALEKRNDMVMKKTMGGSVCALEWVMVILALIASSVTVNATITCEDAILKILPCEPYLSGIGDISVPCCQGAQNLNQMANSTADHRSVCACFKQVGPSLGVNVDRAKKLPDLCKIDLRGITIDFTIDCNTIPEFNGWVRKDAYDTDKPWPATTKITLSCYALIRPI